MDSMQFFCPGRVNIIGDHIDYNGGLVLPAAISLGITASVERSTDDRFYFSSASHPHTFSFAVGDLPEAYHLDYGWCNYPLAALYVLRQAGYTLSPCKIAFSSTLPEGSGLSSSAAIEVLTVFIQNELGCLQIGRRDIALMAQRAERDFVGVNCGIMDQYAVANGEKDSVLLLDCEEVKHRVLPFELDDYALVIMDTKKPRELIHSAYNERRAQCENALAALQQKNQSLTKLVDASVEELEHIADETIRKRARHVVSEQLRVRQAEKALAMGDLHTLGRLLDASHTSLRHSYEVSGMELDAIVEEAKKLDGCIGARMTGAGFGGCAIALVHRQKLPAFLKLLPILYSEKTGYECGLYCCEIAAGVGKVDGNEKR